MKCSDKHGLKLLLGRALSGDVDAWNDFFREIRKYLHAEVKKVLLELGLAGHGPVDASAMVQSAQRRIWERISDQFPAGPEDAALRRFIAWIRTIVRNRTLAEVRRPRPEPGRDDIEGLPDTRPWEQTVKRDRLAAALAAALAGLPERDRQVVELFWFERLSDAEISQRLGCSVGALRVVRFRALRKLRSPELRTLWEESHDGRC